MHTVHPSGWRRQSASTNRLAAIIVAGFCAFNLAGCSRVLDLRTPSATCEVHGDLLQTAEVDYFHGSASNILTMDEYEECPYGLDDFASSNHPNHADADSALISVCPSCVEARREFVRSRYKN